MGKWYDGTKNRKRGNGVIKSKWQKGRKIGTNGKRNTVVLTEMDKRRVRDSRELITNTSILLTHYASR